MTTETLDDSHRTSSFSPVAPGVWRLGVVFVNVYAIESPGGGLVLVDTGLPGLSGWVRRALEAQFGAGTRPEAIVLTHAHFDHAGGAKALSAGWDVPVYAHLLEMPYITGQADYPPPDPTPGGAICFLSRFFPASGTDVGPRAQPLPSDHAVPNLPGWRWVHTPGHTRGHVSLFRDEDRTLIAGDALATTDLDSWTSQITWAEEFQRPATPFTPDWDAALESVRRLAALDPLAVGAGHGRSISGPQVAGELRSFAREMVPPPDGRYSARPAHYRPDGRVESVPPPVPDPLPGKLLLGAALAAGGWMALRALSSRRRGREFESVSHKR